MDHRGSAGDHYFANIPRDRAGGDCRQRIGSCRKSERRKRDCVEENLLPKCWTACVSVTSTRERTVEKNGSGRAVSRVLSALLRAERIICLSSQYPEPVRFRGTGAGRSRVPYLALHPMGFSVPRRLRFERCALTAPFHHHRAVARESQGGLSVFCGTFRRDASRHRLPRVSSEISKVTRHRALWCSDFPPPPDCSGRSDSPPFQNRRQITPKESQNKGELLDGPQPLAFSL